MGWWNSLETVSFLSTTAQWIVAIMGVAVLVFGLRATALQRRADEAERARTAAAVAEARSRADESLDRLRPRSITQEQRLRFWLLPPSSQRALLPSFRSWETPRLNSTPGNSPIS